MDADSKTGSGGISSRAQQLKQELLGEFSLTVDDVAGILEVDRSTVYRYIQDGALAALKLGREYRLSEVDVKGFLQALIERERRRVAELRVKALAAEPAAPRTAAPEPTPVLEPGPGRHGDWGELASAAAHMKASEEARASGHTRVHPAHLLLALLEDAEYQRWAPLFPTKGRMRDGMARQALERLGVDVPALRAAAAALLPPPDAPAGERDLPERSPEVDTVVGRAAEAMAALGRRWVGSDSLLLALYGEPQVAEALAAAGAGEEAARAELRRMAEALSKEVPPEEARFGELAHGVVRDACQLARERGDPAVGPEHLLLALITDDSGAVADGLARRALDEVHADVPTLRAAAEARLGPAGTAPEDRELPQPTPGLRGVVLERATAAARFLGHEHVGTEHLLLGLYSIEELAELLGRGGAPHAAVRAAVRRLAPAGAPQPRETRPLFGQYSERAQRVVEQAQREARRAGMGEVRPEHLVLSLLGDEPREGGMGIARRALENLGVDVPALRRKVEALLPAPRHAPGEPRDAIAFTPLAKTVVMEHAVAATRAMGLAYVGTEHLLLGVYEGGGDLVRVLEGAGAVREGVEAETLHLLAGADAAEPPLDAAAGDALRAAEAEARRLGHAAVLPGHVLLGLLSDDPPVRGAPARAALDRLQVDAAALRAAAEAALPKVRRSRPQGSAHLNHEAGEVVRRHAPAAARAVGAEAVGTGHLLLGLMAVPEVAELLWAAGAPEDALRVELAGVR